MFFMQYVVVFVPGIWEGVLYYIYISKTELLFIVFFPAPLLAQVPDRRKIF